MISTLRVSLLTLFCVFSVVLSSHSRPSDGATPLIGNDNIIDHTYSTIAFYGIRMGEQSLTSLSNLGIVPDNSASWSEISYSSIENLSEEGSLSTIFVSSGTDYVVSDRLVLGVFGELAITDEEYTHNEVTFGGSANLANVGLDPSATTASTEVSGIGLIVGPYAILDLEAGIRLSGKLGYGQSKDEIKPFGTYSDDFELSRILATGMISSSGYSSRAGWAISPSLEYMYYGIATDSYTDSLIIDPANTGGATIQNIIPSMEHIITRLDFGPTFSRNSGNFVWSFGIKGSWSRWDSSSNGVEVDVEDTRVRVNMGIDYAGSSGVQLNFGAYYDGIAADFNSDSYGISLGLNYNF